MSKSSKILLIFTIIGILISIAIIAISLVDTNTSTEVNNMYNQAPF